MDPSSLTPSSSANRISNNPLSMALGNSTTSPSSSNSGGIKSWICPNDRQLMLRAMLGTGWSNRSRDPTNPMKPPGFQLHDTATSTSPNGRDLTSREAISEEEKRHIAEILHKADQAKRVEQNRIDNLKSRVQALKVQTRGDGYNTCLLCGEALGLFKRSVKCDVCGQRFCDKCSAIHHGRTGPNITMCRICHEQREVWKRSGAWQNGEPSDMLNDPPSRSVSILSNSSSNKGGVVDPNALLGQTGWRRYRSIHGHTTVVKPGRTAVLSENADSDSEAEFDATMIGGGLGTPPSMPMPPHTDQLPRKFPQLYDNHANKINAENTPATAPSSPPANRNSTLYDQFSLRTEAASRLFTFAVSRMGWGGSHENRPSEQYSPPPLSPIGNDSFVEASKPFAFVQPRQIRLDSNSKNGKDHVTKLNPTITPLFMSSSNDKMTPNDDGISVVTSTISPLSQTMPASNSNRALSSPMAVGSDADWSHTRSTGQPSEESITDDAQSSTSSMAAVAAPVAGQTALMAGQKSFDSQVAERVSLNEASASATPFDNLSLRSLDVSRSNRPRTLQAAASGPITVKQDDNTPSAASLSPCSLSPMVSVDRRRLSADANRLLEIKSVPLSTSSSKIAALVLSTAGASGILAGRPLSPSADMSSLTGLGPPTVGGRLSDQTAPMKASPSDLSSPTSSLSSFTSQRKLFQRDSTVTGPDGSDIDSEVPYQVPSGAPSIAITEPGHAPDGTLHFTLMYDTAASTLICRILSAKDLASKDINGLSDPYVKVELLPDPCKSSQVKTSVVKKCLNPSWDETIVYEGVLEEDMKAKTLRLQVLDKDPIGYDFIGEARTTLSCLPTDRLLSYNVVLKPAQKEKLLSGAPLLDVGRIRLTFMYNSAESVFIVSGLRLARLARAGKKSTKDPPSPILQIRLLITSAPVATQPAFVTAIQRRSVNCSYGASDILKEKISLKELAKRVVDISVWDNHVNKADCLIGSVQFGITSHGHQLRHFYQAVKSTDIAHTRWHALHPPPGSGSSSGMAGSSASLSATRTGSSSPGPSNKPKRLH